MLNSSLKRWITFAVLALISLGCCLIIQPSRAIQPQSRYNLMASAVLVPSVGQTEISVDRLLAQGQRLYESGQWVEAVPLLEQVVEIASQTGDDEVHLIALRNLALVYQQLQNWDRATGAIAQALNLIEAVPDFQQSRLQGSVLDVQGSIQLDRGQVTAALTTWDQSAQIYQAVGAKDEFLQNQINRSQALQSVGFYRQAIALLSPLTDTNPPPPDSPQQAIALQSLGDALRAMGQLDQSHTILESSLAMAQRLQQPYLIQSAQLSLANTQYAQKNQAVALATYQELAQTSSYDDIQIYAISNQLNALVDAGQVESIPSLWSDVQSHFERLTPNRSLILAYINVAQRFIQLGRRPNFVPDTATSPSQVEIAQFLAIALQQAKTLDDLRSESYVLGTLATLYEQSDRLAEAQDLTDQALKLAQEATAPEISYQWQWLKGRLYKVESDRNNDPQAMEQAIDAYTSAITTLKQLRTNLVSANSQIQVTFQDSVEPIHRQLVSLLLNDKYGPVSPVKIDQARTIIESLQLAELDNFFREACLNTKPVNIDQIDPEAAVLYPIMLEDRLEVVLRLPNQPLRHYASPVTKAEVEDLVRKLRPALTLSIAKRFRSGVTSLYDWMIRPIDEELKNSGVKTLVFVLDGVLRNIPMSTLYDSETDTYLVEHFSIAITPGLQLVQSNPIQNQNLRVLTGALSEARQGFSALPNIQYEIEQIRANVPTQVLFNDSFTAESFQAAMKDNAKPIVHLATHGQFASDKDETFLLTWDSKISIEALNEILQGSAIDPAQVVELLIMSACQTATGDNQAALGLAGMAVRAGARSTIATLWRVSDEATALLMEKLYEELAKEKVSRSEALRQAQLKILHDPAFEGHPYFWAPFILVGSWL